MDVGIGWHYRHQHRVGVADVFVEIARLQRGRRVDDHAVDTVRNAQLKTPRNAERARVCGDAVDRGLVGGRFSSQRELVPCGSKSIRTGR